MHTHDGQDPVPVDVAAVEANNWRTFYDGICPGNPLYGFMFPLYDIQQALQYAEAASGTGVRMYFALDENANYTAFIVPLDANGNDILTMKGSSTIYNMAQPCPSCCGQQDPINLTKHSRKDDPC